MILFHIFSLIPPKNIPSINLLLHIIQHTVIAVGYDGMALRLESGEVVHHHAAEERRAVFQGRFVDDDSGTFRLDALHHPLDGALAEIVAAGLHGEAINSYYRKLRMRSSELGVILVVF